MSTTRQSVTFSSHLRLLVLLHLGSTCRFHRSRDSAFSLFRVAIRCWYHFRINHRAGVPALGQFRGRGPHSETSTHLPCDAFDPFHSQSTLLTRTTQVDDDVCQCHKDFGMVLSLLFYCHDTLVHDFGRIDSSNYPGTCGTGYLEWMWYMLRVLCDNHAIEFDLLEDLVGRRQLGTSCSSSDEKTATDYHHFCWSPCLHRLWHPKSDCSCHCGCRSGAKGERYHHFGSWFGLWTGIRSETLGPNVSGLVLFHSWYVLGIFDFGVHDFHFERERFKHHQAIDFSTIWNHSWVDQWKHDLFSSKSIFKSQRIHVCIFSYIYHKNQPNVGKYTIHGSYGNGLVQWFPFWLAQIFGNQGWLFKQQPSSTERTCEKKPRKKPIVGNRPNVLGSKLALFPRRVVINPIVGVYICPCKDS